MTESLSAPSISEQTGSHKRLRGEGIESPSLHSEEINTDYTSFIQMFCSSTPASGTLERPWVIGSPEPVQIPSWSRSTEVEAIHVSRIEAKPASLATQMKEVTFHAPTSTAKSSPATPLTDRDALEHFLASRGGVDSLINLKAMEAMPYIDLLDDTISSTNDQTLRGQCLDMLRKICGATGLFPKSFQLAAGSVKQKGHRPEAAGGYADIWRGEHCHCEVAVKVFRGYDSSGVPPLDMKALFKEATIWKHMRHPNITPFIGIDTELFPLSLVCEWMPHGTISAYLVSEPSADRLKLLKDIAQGLQYLHGMQVVHGDLKGANVLINKKRMACLADFGLATLCHHGKLTTLSVSAWSPRWTSPEILDPEQFELTRAELSPQSDIYSFSMVAWEVFTGLVPFHDCAHPGAIPWRILSGVRPPRPTGAPAVDLTDDIWGMMEHCWQADPRERPRICDVLTYLAGAIREKLLARLGEHLKRPLSIVLAESDLHNLFGSHFV
ncbi:kinase-like protein [Obba rivulosa]|uniref:Kinase-like protein n=1 Tax=Obba rivulosa TaxID=1052685 RepID=A0A8E2DHE6_9APHY|nr:kinase-like protein [Obba rivulosa]